MNTILSIILLVNTLLTISLVFIERRKPEDTVIWMLILNFLPVVGFVMYLMFGGTLMLKISQWRINRHLKEEYNLRLYKQLQQMDVAKEKGGELALPSTASMVEFHINYSQSPISTMNSAEILTSVPEKHKRLFEDIERAQHSIHVLYYIIHSDEAGKALVEVLTRKAKQGVEVRVLYDGFGSIATPWALFRELIEAGGKVCKFRPFLVDLNFRNHRKIVVIDGLIGYTGGMNIDNTSEHRPKTDVPPRDTQVRLTGDCVQSLQYYFLQDWARLYKHSGTDIKVEDIQNYFPDPEETGDNLPVQIVASGPSVNSQSIRMGYLKMINSATERLWIQTPYIIPDETILDALKIAASSGVDVRIMMPKRPGAKYLTLASNYYVGDLISTGVRIFKYPSYMHSKTMIVDGKVTCIGSANLDIRSLELNDEIWAYFYDREFALKHERIYETDLSYCQELDYEAFKKRGVWTRMEESVMKLFSPLL